MNTPIWQIPISSHVMQLPRVETGAAAVAAVNREGARPLIMLNSNEGAYGPFPEALDAIAAAVPELNRYPDPTGAPLAEQLAAHYGFRPEHLIVENGSTILLFVLAAALLEPGDDLVYPWPSFPQYPNCALHARARPIAVPLRDHRMDVEAMRAAITPRTRMVILCSPNNPTGAAVSHAELEYLVKSLPPGVVLVCDEAYAEYADDFAHGLDYAREGRPVCVLRTFSKVYGLAGARAGFGIGPPPLMDALRRVQLTFPLNNLALAAAQASLPLQERVAERARLNALGRERFYAGFSRLGLEFVPSQANFVLVDVGRDALEVSRQLTRRGILVRPGSQYNYPTHVRVTVGLPEENELLLAALEPIVRGETEADGSL
jgi:histidinol-phosphate aminotransferase